MRCTLVLVSLMLGCTLDSSGLAMGSSSSADDGPGPGSSTGSPSDPSTSTSASASTSDGSGSTASLDGDSSGSSSSTGEPDPSTTGDPGPTARSCAEILDEDPEAPTGIHSIVRSDDAVEEVWCEMELDGGGWTLVGRSAPGPEQDSFGWGQSLGMVGVEGDPYSLNAADVGLSFEEILIARSTEFATPVENAYVIEVPESFLADHPDDAFEHESLRVVLGGCDPGSVSMLRWVGHTTLDSTFFLRDYADRGTYGLRSNGFNLVHNNCSQGAELNNQQGALFVR